MSLVPKSKFLSVFNRNISFFKKKVKKEAPYLVVRATQEQHKCIRNLMWCSYFAEEPTTVSIGLGAKFNPVLDDIVTRNLSEGLTLIAKCKRTGNIVGACLNRTSCAWDPDLTEQMACAVTCGMTRNLLNFHAHLHRSPDLWEKYCTMKIFEIAQVFVVPEQRGKGIGLLLVDASRTLGADCGYRVVRADCTSYYGSQICKRLGMKKVLEIPYNNYFGAGQSTEPLFKPKAPHHAAEVYIDTPLYR